MFQKPPSDLLLHWVKTGSGQQISTIPWVSSDYNNIANSSTGGYMRTGPWFDQFGNVFMLKKSDSTLAVGNIIEWSSVATDTVTSATVRVVTLTTGGLTVGAEAGNLLFDTQIGAGTNKTDALKFIITNTANTITVSNLDTKQSNLQNDPNAYIVAPAANDNLTIIRPYNVKIFAHGKSADDVVVGVSLGAVTSGNWGLFQTAGLALVSSKGDVTALVANAPVIADSTTDGFVMGSAAVPASPVGIATVASAAAAAAAAVTPVWLTISQFC